MTDDAGEADLLYVPPKFWSPMDLSSLKPGGFRRALNGAGMIWLCGVWVGILVVATVRPAPPAPQMPSALAMAALCVPLTLWQLFGVWRICSLPTGEDGRSRRLSPKIFVQCLLCGIGLPAVLSGALVLLVIIVARP
ncbi:hypothetical protein OT109_19555 [Phycisphaeraceae bacterium D3-23]